MTVCPDECKINRKSLTDSVKELYDMSIPKWVRSVLVYVIGVIFIMISSLWIYSVTNFSTKNEVQEVKEFMRDMTKEIKMEIRSLRYENVRKARNDIPE